MNDLILEQAILGNVCLPALKQQQTVLDFAEFLIHKSQLTSATIAVFDRVRHPIAQSYPPAPGCWSFTLYPPLTRGGRGGAHIALHPSEIRYSFEIDSEDSPVPQLSAPELTADVAKTPVGKRLWEPAAASDRHRDEAIDCRGNRTGNGGTTGQTSRLI